MEIEGGGGEKLHFLLIVCFLRTMLFEVIVFEKESATASTNSDLVNLGSLLFYRGLG